MAKLIAQMVIRNEVDRYLELVLTRLSQQVDEIVITDDCSDDDSVEVARDLGASVMVLPEPTFVKNEGVLRQAAWSHLSMKASVGDWILAIDADEVFFPNENLDQWLAQTRYNVLGITFFHMWNDTSYRVDKAWKPTLSSRLFRFKEMGQFKQSRLASGSEPLYVGEEIRKGFFYPHTGFRMQHLGYMRDEDKKAKYDRYMELDKGDFHSIQHLRSILDEDPTLQEWSD